MTFKSQGKGTTKKLQVSIGTCRKRVADAKLIGWQALAESWQRDLDRLLASKNQRKD